MINFRHTVRKIVNAGIRLEEDSLSQMKSVVILTRVLLISILTLCIYTIFMLALGMHTHALMCFASIPVMAVNYYFIAKKRLVLAKNYFAIFMLILFAVFSVIFGKGIGSEYWIIVIAGLSLLIFDEKKNAFKYVFVSIGAFLLVELTQHKFESLVDIDNSYQKMVYVANLSFIFITAFVLSLVLRFGTEDFENRIQIRYRMLTKKNKDLTDSITYASRIQNAVLPQENLKEALSKNIFVLFKPKDIVSGDFYWMHNFNDRLLFAIVDGVGHGVSGALVSIMAHTLLNQCVEEYDLKAPKDILAKMNDLIQERKKQWNDDLADHLEITLCCYEWKTNQLQYISNGNALYLIKHVNNVCAEDEMEIIGEDRYILKEIRNPYSFGKKTISTAKFHIGSHKFQKDDMLYVSTNGLASQLGGPKLKKLSSKRLRDLLMSVQHLSLPKQRLIIEDVLKNWQGKVERTDDITLIGFKI